MKGTEDDSSIKQTKSDSVFYIAFKIDRMKYKVSVFD